MNDNEKTQVNKCANYLNKISNKSIKSRYELGKMASKISELASKFGLVLPEIARFTIFLDWAMDKIEKYAQEEDKQDYNILGFYVKIVKYLDVFNGCKNRSEQRRLLNASNYAFYGYLKWLHKKDIITLIDIKGQPFYIDINYPPEIIDNIFKQLQNKYGDIIFEKTEETYIKTTERIIIKTKKENDKNRNNIENKIIESKNYQEIPEPPNQYNLKQLAKINQDFKISTDNLSQEEIEKIIYNNLNKYIDWNNNIDKKSIIEKPVIFVNKYLDNPLSLTIDFTQYYAYLKKLDKEKTIEENQKQQEKLEQEKQKKEKYIDNLYEIFKECNKDEYKKLYEKYKKELLTTNNFLRMRYNSGKTSMLDIVIEGEIRKELAKRNNIC